MKKILIIATLCSTMLAATPLFADGQSQAPLSASQWSETVTQVRPGVNLRTYTFFGTDAPAVSDPLGNSPVTPVHDRGPAITNQVSYDANCQDPACQRAFARWHSNTTWQQDKARGM